MSSINLATNQCNICLSRVVPLETLQCNDKYCRPCIISHILTQIENLKVLENEIKCPNTVSCSFSIPEALIQSYLNNDQKNRLIYLREKARIRQMVIQGIAVECETRNCNGFGRIIQGENITACIICKNTLCCLCKHSSHPRKTCAEAANETRDVELENYLIANNIKKCPVCGNLAERLNGCNFLTCCSSMCRGQHGFCKICGKHVTITPYSLH